MKPHKLNDKSNNGITGKCIKGRKNAIYSLRNYGTKIPRTSLKFTMKEVDHLCDEFTFEKHDRRKRNVIFALIATFLLIATLT